MDAQGALDSLLGRLTTVLVNEAQLLGGVRSDVEFIKDEMESMNGLILYLTEAQHPDHQVRAWMKQVVGLTRDCEGNVELYVHYVGSRPGDDGLLGYLRRITRFLRTILVRHRIATRIQELKVRARDVGDRCQRYGVTVPESTKADMNAVDVEPSRGEEDLRRRAVLLDAAEPPPDGKEVVRRGMDTLMKWLSMEPAITEYGAPPPQVRVFSILGGLADTVAIRVYQQHSSVATMFDCKAWSDQGDIRSVLMDIMEQVEDVQLQPGQEEEEDLVMQLISRIQGHLKGKRFLIVILVRLKYWEWKSLQDALLHADGSLPGSAIVMSTEDYDMALLSSPYKIFHARHPRFMEVREFYIAKSRDLLGSRPTNVRNEDVPASSLRTGWVHVQKTTDLLGDIFDRSPNNTFPTKTFLHLLYVNPNRTDKELQEYQNNISDCTRLNKSISNQVLLWCYSELPSKYRSCLLYLTVFPERHVIRTTSLARRWVAEGLITATTTSTTATNEIRSSTDEAEHYLDVLFIRGFVSPLEISAEGKIKSCTVHHEVREFISRVATDVNFMDSSLPPHLARYLSIHNRLGLQKSHSDDDSKDIAAYLPSLAASPQWQLLKVLDLEGCKGLDKKHMRSICKILLLKYLSLRNTDVAELPKQIKELQCLETLDIRQTKVQMLARKAIVLPLLKHFLAGHGHKVSASNDSMTSQGSFSTVRMPLCIDEMKNIEILSHVQISNASELASIAQLLKLRKLGVALHGKHAKLSDLFCQIEKLHRCLRSLSILDAGMVDPLCSTPQFIERLNISGITGGLHPLIQEHPKLTKITLCETQLKEGDLTILGKLSALRCLKLQHNSYTTECEIVFRVAEFQSLNYLIVEGKDVSKMNFASGAAPKLERIVWSFARMDALSGLNHLSKLKKLELNGDCDLHPIEKELFLHPNEPTLKHKPHHQRQEDRTAAPTSSSSAP